MAFKMVSIYINSSLEVFGESNKNTVKKNLGKSNNEIDMASSKGSAMSLEDPKTIVKLEEEE